LLCLVGLAEGHPEGSQSAIEADATAGRTSTPPLST
jgi:hypothetical protein